MMLHTCLLAFTRNLWCLVKQFIGIGLVACCEVMMQILTFHGRLSWQRGAQQRFSEVLLADRWRMTNLSDVG